MKERREPYVDLHTHTTGSDGTLSPTQLVKRAASLGLCAVAITDHDSVSGIDEAIAAAADLPIEVVPGVELSTEYSGTEIHVVGLFIDRTNAELRQQLIRFRDNRDNRNVKMINWLQEAGYRITAKEIYARNPGAVIARPHIARYLTDTGQAESMQWVFDHLIGAGCPYYVERYKITPMRAVELIHAAGGTAILAHPCMYKISRELLIQMVEEMITAGLDGIEALYSRSKDNDEAYYRSMAERYGLLLSGGSDFHGSNKPDIELGTGTGNLRVPAGILENIKAYRKEKGLA